MIRRKRRLFRSFERDFAAWAGKERFCWGRFGSPDDRWKGSRATRTRDTDDRERAPAGRIATDMKSIRVPAIAQRFSRERTPSKHDADFGRARSKLGGLRGSRVAGLAISLAAAWVAMGIRPSLKSEPANQELLPGTWSEARGNLSASDQPPRLLPAGNSARALAQTVAYGEEDWEDDSDSAPWDAPDESDEFDVADTSDQPANDDESSAPWIAVSPTNDEPEEANEPGPWLSDSEFFDATSVDRESSSDTSRDLSPGESESAPWMDAPRDPVAASAEFAASVKQVEERVWKGFGLAARGASFSARAELIAALTELAQRIDLESASDVHYRALAAGLNAIEEAEDFLPRGSRLDEDLDALDLASDHRTPIFHESQESFVSPLAAQRAYLQYASERLAFAVGHEPAGSLAFYAMGKLHGVMASDANATLELADAKAEVFHQAAVTADPRNYLAANELAVYLAREGRWPEARDMLVASVSVFAHPTTWLNLAEVHRNLGDTKLAELAAREAGWAKKEKQVRLARGDAVGPSTVHWLSPAEFSATSRPSGDLQPPAEALPTRAAGPEAPAATANSKPFPWFNFKRK